MARLAAPLHPRLTPPDPGPTSAPSCPACTTVFRVHDPTVGRVVRPSPDRAG
ncbi:hypothetical protein JQN58_36065 [Aneurinibacillus sp. BA2021]|nr:hypothetical protein [Aneurinibacillus sp. BA2021]